MFFDLVVIFDIILLENSIMVCFDWMVVVIDIKFKVISIL